MIPSTTPGWRDDPATRLATAGSILGALLLYAAGAMVGEARMKAIGQKMPLVDDDDVTRASDTFSRWQGKAVFWGRLIPGVRSLVSIPAGAKRMSLPAFIGFTAVGSLVWNSVLVGAGWFLGDTFGATAAVSQWLNVAVLVGLVGLVGWFVVSSATTRGRVTLKHL